MIILNFEGSDWIEKTLNWFETKPIVTDEVLAKEVELARKSLLSEDIYEPLNKDSIAILRKLLESELQN